MTGSLRCTPGLVTSAATGCVTCESCGTRLDRDHNAARNLAALASQVVHGQLDRDVKQPAGNPRKTATGGNGYRHGNTQTMSQRRPREVATP